MKKVLLVFLLLLGMSLDARVYRGEQNFASNSLTSAWELLVTNTKPVEDIACGNTSSESLYVSYTGLQSNCSDANKDWILQGSGVGAFDMQKKPVEKYVCVRTVADTTVSSGIAHCITSTYGKAN